MYAKEFGKFVRDLRDDRRSPYQSWTRDFLALRASISKQTIERIEKGSVKDLRPYMEQLATAFSLNEFQKAEFYAVAGLVYQPKVVEADLEYQVRLLENLRFPAAVVTSLWDLVAINEYYRLFWHYSADDLTSMQREGEINSNILRFVFDSSLHSTQTLGRIINIYERVVLLFRSATFRYTSTLRYKTIVHHMIEDFPDFIDVWNTVKRKGVTGKEQALIKTVNEPIVHPIFGVMQSMSLTLPRRSNIGTVLTTIYLPLQPDGGTELISNLHQLVSETGNEVYRFPYKPVL